MQVIRDKHSNTYCGPAALSLITGQHVDEVVEAVRGFRRELQPLCSRVVRGMCNHEMEAILWREGYRAKRLTFEYNFGSESHHFYGVQPTLAQWLRKKKLFRQQNPQAKILINITGHYIVLCGRKIYDNCFPEGVWLRKYPHRRKRVRGAWVCVLRAEGD